MDIGRYHFEDLLENFDNKGEHPHLRVLNNINFYTFNYHSLVF